MRLIMSDKNRYRNFFLEPQNLRHKHYEMLRAWFISDCKAKEIAQKFNMSVLTVHSRVRDFKKSVDQDEPLQFFCELTPGPKSDRKKSMVREHIIRLRARGYAGPNIHTALQLAGFKVSLSLIEQVLQEEGLPRLGKRTRKEQEQVAEEIRTQQIPGLTIPQPAAPEIPAKADVRKLDLSSGRVLSCRVMGVFLFVPLLVRVGLNNIVEKTKMAGSKMIPSISYLLSLLTLKLLDKERKSHISDWNFDEVLGLFAGLNRLPKTTAATDYSYRLIDNQHNILLAEWVQAVYPIICSKAASAFALDFHSIPHRGEDSPLENHYVPSKGKAKPSILSFFARAIDSPMLCYANADVLRKEQANMPLKFVTFWKEISGFKPEWLYLDSKVTTYEILDQLREEKINFITIRQRGKRMVEKVLERPESEWRAAFIDTPQRRHQRIKHLEQMVRLKGYTGKCRQIVVTGLGRATPTFFLTNNEDVSGREILLRYIQRNYIENDLGINVNFFHMDCLSSEVRLNVNLDVVLTVIANGCYRWLSQRLKGCEKMEPKQLYRKFVETGGKLFIKDESIIIRFDRRSHNPILRQAALDDESVLIPWLEGKRLRFEFS